MPMIGNITLRSYQRSWILFDTKKYQSSDEADGEKSLKTSAYFSNPPRIRKARDIMRSFIVCFSLSILLFTGSYIQTAVASDWEPVDPALLSATTPLVEADADVEGIFWEVWVSDYETGDIIETELKHYIRLKIFTERGIEYAKKVDIVYPDGVSIKDIKGRTIKPDGSVEELDKDSVFERTLTSIRNRKMKSKSFALPGIEPGAIVEYRWKEIRPFSMYSRFHLQRDIPIQIVTYHIKAFQADWLNYGMNMITFNAQQIERKTERDGSLRIKLDNVPAFKEEPQMPPEDTVRAFVLTFYREGQLKEASKYWNDFGKKQYKEAKQRFKPNDDIREKTVEVIGNSTNPEEVIEKLFQFVRSNIKNINDDALGLTPKQRDEIKENKKPADTLKRGTGTVMDILEVFGSMATAAGLEVRMAWTGDRSDFFFNPGYADAYFLSNPDVVIRVGDEWKFYDPSAAYLPIGMLRWSEEGNNAMIPDPNESIFVITPLSDAEKSQIRRKANLKLGEDGTLEGDVVLEYTGHPGAEKKEYNDDDSPTQQEETLKDMIKEKLSTAEITRLQVENVTDSEKPFTYRFHIRIPDYGQRTGRRLFFQPAFFQKGIQPLFTTSQRKYDIYINYPWSEVDEIEITLPEGYELEAPEGRQPINAGDTAKHELRLMVSDDQRTVKCIRNFFFGSKDNLLFEVDSYEILKRLFDAIHEADNHTLTLRQSAAR